VIRPPDFTGSLEARTFYPMLADLQQEFPDCIIHLHGSYSYRCVFGLGFRSGDLDPSEGRGSSIHLPMGKQVKRSEVAKYRQWLTTLGSRTAELNEPRDVCMFNIRSALWAGQHFNELNAFRVAPSEMSRKATIEHYNPGAAVTMEDKFLCDRCSLAVSCKYFREGAVCSLPGSESVELSRFFTTRDSDIIVAGLTRILGVQADRLQTGLEAENLNGELDPEVTRIADGLFEKGLKLAKLLNPALDPRKPTVAVNVNSAGPTQVNAGQVNMQEMVSRAFTELEERGIPREMITSDMVEAHMLGKPLALPSGS
jgi:hypothetical protein